MIGIDAQKHPETMKNYLVKIRELTSLQEIKKFEERCKQEVAQP